MSNDALNRSDWQHLVISQLDRIEARQVEDGKKIYDLHGAVSGLKVRSSIFGLIGGLIVALLARLGIQH
jgi:hypothetical protein